MCVCVCVCVFACARARVSLYNLLYFEINQYSSSVSFILKANTSFDLSASIIFLLLNLCYHLTFPFLLML